MVEVENKYSKNLEVKTNSLQTAKSPMIRDCSIFLIGFFQNKKKKCLRPKYENKNGP